MVAQHCLKLVLVTLLLLRVLPVSLASGQTLGEALGAPSLNWIAGGEGTWRVAVPPPFPGIEGIEWNTLGAGENGWVETNVAGPGVLRCVWAQPGDGRGGTLLVDGLPAGEAAETWAPGTPRLLAELGPGDHTLRWVFRGQAVAGACFLGGVQWEAGASAGLAAGLDLPPGVITAQWPGDDGWHGTGSAVSSGCQRYDHSLTVFVDGPARLSFSAHVSAVCDPQNEDGVLLHYLLAGAGAMDFYSPGSAGLPPDAAWRPQNLLLGAGRQSLQLYFETDDSAATVMLDAMVVDREHPPLPAQVLSADSAREWRFSGGWEVTSAGADGVGGPSTGALQHNLISPAWLETEVAGPVLADLAVTGLTRGMRQVRVELDGTESPAVKAIHYSGWDMLRVPVPGGRHTLRWAFTPAAGTPVKVDDFRLDYAPVPAGVPEAFGYPGGRFYTDAAGTVIASPSGRTDAGVLAGPSAYRTLLLLQPPGPAALVSFWRRGQREMSAGGGSWFTTLTTYPLPDATDWRREEFVLAGSEDWRQMTWGFFARNASVTLDDLMLDTTPVSLAEAADDPDAAAVWSAENAAGLRSTLLARDGQDAIFLTSSNSWVERIVAGPAVIRSSGIAVPRLDAGTAPPASWNVARELYILVPPGTHTLRWGQGILDRVSLQRPLPVEDALGVTAAGLTSVGVAGVLLEEATANEMSVAVFAPATPAHPSWLERMVTGPAQVRWQEQPLLQGALRCTVDGALAVQDAGEAAVMQDRGLLLPAGAHRLRWEWTVPAVMMMDSLIVSPLPEVKPGQLFAAAGITFSSGTAAGWQVDHRFTPAGYEASLAPAAGAGPRWLESSITGPADVFFTSTSVVTVSVADRFTFPAGRTAGPPAEGTVTLPAGTHTVRWLATEGTRLGRFRLRTPGSASAIASDAGQESWPWWALWDGYSLRAAVTTVSGPCILKYRPVVQEPSVLVQQTAVSPVAVAAPAGGASRSIWLPPGQNVVIWSASGTWSSSPPATLVGCDPMRPLPPETVPGPGFRDPIFAPGQPWQGFEIVDSRQAFAPPDSLPPGASAWCEAKINGPALLEFTPMVLAGDAILRLSIDGRTAGSWQSGQSLPVRWPLTQSSQEVRWEFSRPALTGSAVAAGYLENLKLLPLPDLSAAMGAPALTWRSAPAVPYYFDGAGARPVDVPGAVDVWLETVVAGPAALDVQWLNTTHILEVNGRPLVSADIDPVNIRLLPQRYLQGTLMLPPGESLVRWRGAAAVPPVVLRPLTTPFALGTGPLEAPYYTSRSTTAWTAHADEGYDSAPSFRSTGVSALWLPVEGPGTLHFAWKTTAPASSTGARCHLDGVRVLSSERGSMPWQTNSLAVPAGWHRVQWVGSFGVTTFVDAIRWEPGTAFGQWAAARIPRWTDRGSQSDPDGDGFPNLMEFALGQSPLLHDAWQPPMRLLPDSSVVEITFPSPAVPANHAILTVEVAENPAAWTTADPASIVIRAEHQTLHLAPPWRFARLRAALP